ncbi:MAG TPA: hypothetical protein VEA69_16490 [Tepidisphaeraceae bacterium]|nr:hypothetical protein [Tepidisphaeraceae bacterium]
MTTRKPSTWTTRLLALAIAASAGGSALAMDYLRPPRSQPLLALAAAEQERLSNLATTAVFDNPVDAKKAIAELRAAGPAGLAAMMSTHQVAIDRHRNDPTTASAQWDRLAAALDAVAAQKDAWSSGVYWYTDLEAAKKVAAASNKPILSLRLLGTLDTEFSCANSRFFRTVLYPNATVGQYLKDRFVLHWQSHRPVPRLTIDYGDGRVVERTITGNSAHYVLTSEGKVVDVIPGLYGPAAFVRTLQAAEQIARNTSPRTFDLRLAQWHRNRAAALRQQWAADLAAIGAPVVPTDNKPGQSARALPEAPPRIVPSDNTLAARLRVVTPSARPDAAEAKRLIDAANASVFTVAAPAPPRPAAGANPPPAAAAAARVAVSKSAMELAPVLAVAPDRTNLATATSDDTWAKLAELRAADAKLDAGSRAVMLAKAGPSAVAANERTASKRVVESPLNRLVRSFERSVAEDTVRNEYLFHLQIHEWFAAGTAPKTLDDLNEKVYAELFLMPKSDPWLGLVPPDAYTALPATATSTAAAK